MSNSILITGGAGFIGSHIVDIFVEHDYKVIVIDNFCSENSGYRNKDAIYIDIDILSDKFEDVFRKYEIDYCIHLAAQTSVSVAEKKPIFNAQENIVGTINVIENCKKYGIKKLIAASSAAVYGNPQYIPIDEKHSTEVLSQYGLSKLTMEKYIKLSGLNYLIYRFSNVYGERQTAYGEAGVVAIFSHAIRNNQTVYIDSDGNQTRDFIYVKDIAKACYLGIERDIKNEIINLSTNSAVSINKLFNILSQKCNYNKAPIYRKKRNGDIEVSILDNSKLLNLIDFELVPVEQGLDKLVKENYANE